MAINHVIGLVLLLTVWLPGCAYDIYLLWRRQRAATLPRFAWLTAINTALLVALAWLTIYF